MQEGKRMATKAQTKAVDATDLIDIPGGAALVFMKPKTIANWFSQGVLTRYKIGGRTLLSKSELLALIRKVE